MDQSVEVTGVVKSWALINPHPELIIEVTDESGETKELRVYALGVAGMMSRAGWTRDSLVPVKLSRFGAALRGVRFIHGRPKRNEGFWHRANDGRAGSAREPGGPLDS